MVKRGTGRGNARRRAPKPPSPSKKSSGAPRTSPSVWPLLARRTLGDFKVFSVRGERTRSPRSGKPHDFFVLECTDWANVVALTDSREVVLVRQFRAGTRSVTLEIPGGSVEKGESAAAAVRRELREETGYAAGSWTRIGVVHPNPAIQGNRCFTYLATGCRRVGALMPDEGEDLAVELVPLRRIPDLIRKGRITHSLVIAAFHFLSLR
ncbi:MAG TPA: NUDIX hydrolase [Thermoanaerobaculia bacterium]|nr:NUDIX hydrolase [Thermoanaerobaculia bacterium]